MNSLKIVPPVFGPGTMNSHPSVTSGSTENGAQFLVIEKFVLLIGTEQQLAEGGVFTVTVPVSK